MEMGGYLPIELVKGNSWFFSLPDDQVWALNTGRTSIWAAITNLKPTRIFVPYYYCPDVIEMIESLCTSVCFYHLNEDLLPDPEELSSYSDGDCLILVDYFGILYPKLLSYVNQYPRLILDFCHSFYSSPVMKPGVYNVYSCRKFFGVSDGAYLIGQEIEKTDLPQDTSSERSLHLLVSLEKGTNAAYKENKTNEEVIGKEHLTMSPLTTAILNGVNYDQVALSRKQNYAFLRNRLGHLSNIELPQNDNVVPYCFPLVLDTDIHPALIQHKIYVPYLWQWLLDEKWNGNLEQRLSRNLIPVPLDQRYNADQLEWMCNQIEEIIQEK